MRIHTPLTALSAAFFLAGCTPAFKNGQGQIARQGATPDPDMQAAIASVQQEGRYVSRGAGQQDVSLVKDSNAKMNEAMATARKTVPQFIAVLQNPAPTQTRFSVKMLVSDGKVGEHMWLHDLTCDRAGFHGKLADDPFEAKGYHKGQNMTVAPSKISDWMYYNSGIRQGGYTEKVIEEMKK